MKCCLSHQFLTEKPLGSQVKWMMYWIVFALFTTAETITDVFLAFWYVGLNFC